MVKNNRLVIKLKMEGLDNEEKMHMLFHDYCVVV